MAGHPGRSKARDLGEGEAVDPRQTICYVGQSRAEDHEHLRRMFPAALPEPIGRRLAHGLPLPLMSYGGSATIMTMASLGLLLNVKRRRLSLFY